MLYFHIRDTSELIASMTLDDIKWLTKFNIIKKGNTGLLEDDGVETLPFFDDYDLTYINALSMSAFSKDKIDKMKKIQGFQSETLDKFINILNVIIEDKLALSVTCS